MIHSQANMLSIQKLLGKMWFLTDIKINLVKSKVA